MNIPCGSHGTFFLRASGTSRWHDAAMSSRFSRLADVIAVPGLIRYVALFNALVFILHLLAPGYASVLDLDPSLVLRGEVWRLVTWIFIPETMSPFWIFFALLFLIYLGDGLEEAVGPSKLTLFYASGVILCTLSAFLSWTFFGGVPLARANTFLNLSLLLAFASVYPDFKVLVFFVLPMRIVWLAGISAVLMIVSAIGQPIVVAATLGAAFLNWFLFFGRELIPFRKGALRGFPTRAGSTQSERNGGFSEPLHRCVVCSRTEASHPDLDFRVSSSGEDYCLEHLPK